MAEVLRQHVCATLERGSSLFNSGMHQQCAEAYHECAMNLRRSRDLPPDCAAVLEQAMQRAAIFYRETGGADRSAWQLRGALEYTLNALTPAGMPMAPMGSYGYGPPPGGYGPPPGGYGGGGPPPGMAPAPAWSNPAALQNANWQGAVDYGRQRDCRDSRMYKPMMQERPAPGYSPGWGGVALGAAGGLAAGALIGDPCLGWNGPGSDMLMPAVVGGALGAGAVNASSRRGNSGGAGNAVTAGLGGAAVGLMLGDASSPADVLATGGGALAGSSLGGSYGGVGGAVLGGVLGGGLGGLFF